jgi:hypothetical protein
VAGGVADDEALPLELWVGSFCGPGRRKAAACHAAGIRKAITRESLTNVRAPRGTDVQAKAGGLFKNVKMNRSCWRRFSRLDFSTDQGGVRSDIRPILDRKFNTLIMLVN